MRGPIDYIIVGFEGNIYRLITNKKDSEEPSKSNLVAGVGLEPTTLWL